MTLEFIIKLFLLMFYLREADGTTAKDDCKNVGTFTSEVGWYLKCGTYDIEYSVNSQVKVTCTEFVLPYSQSMFVNYNISEIRSFKFVECPPPNTTFGEVLAGMKVLQLTFEVFKHEIDLPGNVFAGLPDLDDLVLNVTLSSTISAKTFSNLPKLDSLSLEAHLTTIPENLLGNLSSLTKLKLLGNRVTTLHEGLFRSLGNLMALILDVGALEHLPDEIFSSLLQLEHLSIAKNNIKTFPSTYMRNLKLLKAFSLSENKLEQLDGNLLQENKQLQNLDLSFNPTLKALPEDLLENLQQLKNISLESCNLTLIPDNFFSHAANLQNIHMQNNRITNISSKMFSGNPRLKVLLMQDCDVINISQTAFANSFELEYFHIGHNNLQCFQQGVFDKMVSLTVLILSEQLKVATLPPDIFSNLQQLKTLDLRNNVIDSFSGATPFGRSNRLETIDLSYNRLLTGPEINWDFYDHTITLNLEKNYLEKFSLPILKSDSATVKASHNFIETVSVDNILQYTRFVESSGRPRTITFELADNHFNCDCRLLKFAEYIKDTRHTTKYRSYKVIFAAAEQYNCTKPANLLNHTLINLKSQDFICPVNESCPTPCNCYFREMDGVTVVNCSDRGLDKLPTTLPSNTTELYFQRNNLTTINSTDLTLNLSLLDLSENQIENLDSWQVPPNLTDLNLQGNRLTRVPSSVLDFVNRNTTKSISLGNNPIPCNCSTADLQKSLLLKSHVFMDIQYIYCDNSGKLLVNIDSNDLCPYQEYSKSLIFSLVSLCVILAIALPTGLVLYYKNKQTVIAYLYIHVNCFFSLFFDEEELDESKTYDAFISYHHSNEGLAQTLLEELENNDTFKLCIHGRDWLPGNLIVDNICNSVQNSRRTILVISKPFLDSIWFQIEFHTAYYQMLEDKIDRLIIVIQGELPEKSTMDKDLQVLLSTKTYLVWGEKWFWEKLRYAMPHKKKRKTLEEIKSKPPKKKNVRAVPKGVFIKNVMQEESTQA